MAQARSNVCRSRRRARRFAGALVALAAFSTASHAADGDGLPSFLTATPNWSGFYGGLVGTYGFGDAHSDFNVVHGGADFPAQNQPTAYDAAREGLLGGFELGYNYRLGSFILGPELDGSFGHLFGQSSAAGISAGAQQFPFSSTHASEIDRLATLRLRAGYLPLDPLLLYLTGGLAVGNVSDSTGLNFVGGAHYQGLRTQLQAGWTAGAGTELALTPSWRLKFEYLYYDLGTTTVNGYRPDPSFFHTQSNFTTSGQLVRLGVNYRLGDVGSDGGGAVSATSPLAFLSELNYEVGTGYFFSTGTFRYDLYGFPSNAKLSRLTYTGLHANAGEVFARIEHPSGVFVKGVVGAGAVASGRLVDEDFEPFTTPYSRTNSTQWSGGLSYASADLGYYVYDRGGLRIGPFAGYNYLREQYNAYGCEQAGSNPEACFPGQVSPSALVISESAAWQTARFGVAGEWQTGWHGLRFTAEGAWNPFGSLNGVDLHQLRLDTPTFGFTVPATQTAAAHGVQFEASAHLPLADALEFGIGGRYWDFYAHGSELTEPNFSQPTNFFARRYGGFAQLGAHF